MYCVICQEIENTERKQRKEEIKIIGNKWCFLIWFDVFFKHSKFFYILFKEVAA